MFTGLLAKVAFSAFGRKITVGLILKIVAGLIIAFLLWLVYDKVRDHFKHISDLEANVTKLESDKKQLQADLGLVIEVNRKNAQINKTSGEQKAAATVIADTEVKASTTRATQTKERADVIRTTPPTADPVAPVVLSTLDSLWGQEPAEDRK